MEGNISYEDTTGETGQGAPGRPGVDAGRWRRLARRRVRRFRLAFAAFSLGGTASRARLGPAHSVYLKPDQIERDGPAAVLLGVTVRRAARSPRRPRSTTCRCRSGPASGGHIGRPPGTRWDGPRSASAAFVRRKHSKPVKLAPFEESNEPSTFTPRPTSSSSWVRPSSIRTTWLLGYYSVHTNGRRLARR